MKLSLALHHPNEIMKYYPPYFTFGETQDTERNSCMAQGMVNQQHSQEQEQNLHSLVLTAMLVRLSGLFICYLRFLKIF